MHLLWLLGHAQCLPVSLPQLPGFISARNATPRPSPVTVEILPALSRLSSDANLCPPKPCEPSRPQPHGEICLSVLCIPLAPYLVSSGDKFCLLLALSWDVACLSC